MPGAPPFPCACLLHHALVGGPGALLFSVVLALAWYWLRIARGADRTRRAASRAGRAPPRAPAVKTRCVRRLLAARSHLARSFLAGASFRSRLCAGGPRARRVNEHSPLKRAHLHRSSPRTARHHPLFHHYPFKTLRATAAAANRRRDTTLSSSAYSSPSCTCCPAPVPPPPSATTPPRPSPRPSATLTSGEETSRELRRGHAARVPQRALR